jgi:hypothetical protein
VERLERVKEEDKITILDLEKICAEQKKQILSIRNKLTAAEEKSTMKRCGCKPVEALTGTLRPRFSPLISSDVVVKNGMASQVSTMLQCITAMSAYRGRSLEELRLEDYRAPGGILGDLLAGQLGRAREANIAKDSRIVALEAQLVQKDIDIKKERSQGEILKMLARKFRAQKEAAEQEMSSLFEDGSKELDIETIEEKFKEGNHQKWTLGKHDLTFQPTATSTPGTKRKRDPAEVPDRPPAFSFAQPTSWLGTPEAIFITDFNHCFHFSNPEPVEGSNEG